MGSTGESRRDRIPLIHVAGVRAVPGAAEFAAKGDVFDAGNAVAFIQAADLPENLRIANPAGGTKRLGIAPGMPVREVVEKIAVARHKSRSANVLVGAGECRGGPWRSWEGTWFVGRDTLKDRCGHSREPAVRKKRWPMKKSVVGTKRLCSFTNVLGGTTARCGNRHSGL